ncbi:DNA/RNA non-specific endonuclease [Pseudomonas helleri]|uniref:DNA/RNA non-specific endonuclease n=1 Tax=Pseudomonas helleri TaxID=1608996 RepID=UPI0012FCBBC2
MNHFAQNGNFNNSSYRKLENSWERMLKDKKDVPIERTQKYTGDSLQPDTLKKTMDRRDSSRLYNIRKQIRRIAQEPTL